MHTLSLMQESPESGKLSTTQKNGAKRRRSGIDMVNGGGRVPVLANGDHRDHPHPVVRARLPKIAKSNRATGVWSRKVSPAGVSYLKMDDEVRFLMTIFNLKKGKS